MSVNSTGGKKENGSKTMIWRQRLLKMKGKMMFRVLIFYYADCIACTGNVPPKSSLVEIVLCH